MTDWVATSLQYQGQDIPWRFLDGLMRSLFWLPWNLLWRPDWALNSEKSVCFGLPGAVCPRAEKALNYLDSMQLWLNTSQACAEYLASGRTIGMSGHLELGLLTGASGLLNPAKQQTEKRALDCPDGL